MNTCAGYVLYQRKPMPAAEQRSAEHRQLDDAGDVRDVQVLARLFTA
jgi:hypothetical protein